MRTVQEMAREAVAIQDACNPLGLTKAFANVTQELRDVLDLDTFGLCNHPVFRLWASKLHELACLGLSDTEQYAEAYHACIQLAHPEMERSAA